MSAAATTRPPDPAFDKWVDKAKEMSVLATATRLGFSPKSGALRAGAGMTGELSGPCPLCHGVDRFSVKPSENAWYCRGAGRGGYDSISLVRYVREFTFLEAVEFLAGEPRPEREAKLDPEAEQRFAEEQARRREQDDKERAEAAQRQNQFREDERRRCHALWCDAAPAAGTLVEAYLRHRGIGTIPTGAKLRFHPQMHLRHPAGPGGAIVWTGPAMLAPIAGNDGRFMGLHITFLDPRLRDGTLPSGEKGKLVFRVEGEAEPLAAKRSRGSKAGGHLVLAPAVLPVTRIVIGEGIETVLSVWITMLEAGEDLRATEFWSSVDLGNLGGKAAETVPHPTLKKEDAAGRMRTVRLPGPVPDLREPERAIALPGSATDVLILADGDSDRFAVACTAKRANARWAAPGRTVRIAWPEGGTDFNDMRMRRLRAATEPAPA